MKLALGIIWMSTISTSYKITDKSLLVKDLLNTYYKSSFIVVQFSCDNTESVSMASVLTKEGHSISICRNFEQPIPYYLPHNKLFYIVDTQCNITSEILNEAEHRKLFTFPYKWLFIDDDSIMDITIFESMNILVDSDITIAGWKDVRTYHLFKIFKRNRGLPIVQEHFGMWDNGTIDIAENFEKKYFIRRGNLNGIKLNCSNVVTHNDTFNHFLDKRDKHIDSLFKVNYVYSLHMQDMLNVTFNFYYKSTWGYKKNSSWSGMMGELVSGKADFGGTSLFMTADRVSIIDYIAMTTPTRSLFVFKQPKLSYITNVFTLPFETDVWISSAALVIIIVLALYLVIKWEWYKKKVYKINNATEHTTDTELQDSFWDISVMAVGAICQQGASAVPFDSPGRILTILLFISLMFLYTSYSANIVALLQSSSTSIQTLQDLLNPRFQVGVDDTVFNRFYFPNASEPIRRALYLQKVAPPGQPERFFSMEEGVRRIRGGLFAFHMEAGPGYKLVSETFTEDEKCDLSEISFLQVTDPWMAIQKNSSFKKMFTIGLRKIRESGIQPREVSLIYTKKPVCTSRGSSFVGVGIIDCYTAAVVAAGGIILSACVLLIEILYHRFRSIK